ncbi:MAG: hypothetical protein A3G75_09575 [Verrucomicrobia bacterium RIFCSPLOWO2_12_FULL_64_8]|nr:MAG: hypothetical protein A3G75_09575 [Verrucomicrobia bacterium RIFCSPLOWO2_12_FULL_64_8]
MTPTPGIPAKEFVNWSRNFDLPKFIRRASIALALAIPAFSARGETRPADDTFAELEKPGPVIRVVGSQGYRTFILMHWWEDGTVVDARGARWSTYGWGKAIRHPRVNDTTRNSYPIQVGADWIGAYPVRKDLYNFGFCPAPQSTRLFFIGGVVEGTQPLDASWIESKASNGGGITLNALHGTIDGVRIHNIHDGILPLEGNDFTLKNCWISRSRDDAIENDGFASGLVDDCLFEDNYCFYSARNTAGGAGSARTPIDPKTGKHAGEFGAQPEAPGGGRHSVIRFRNNLIGLGNLPGANSAAKRPGEKSDRDGFGHFWKQSDVRNPQVELVDNIFFIPRPFPGCEKNRYDVMPQGLKKAEGNIVIWMGDGRYPFAHPGFKVLSGTEGLAFWENARAEWIARHPGVGRVAGDPGYDPAVHGAAESPPADLLKAVAEVLDERPAPTDRTR